MLNELRQSLRMVLKQPGFTLITVLTLALGIGATCAVFSLVQGVLLTPPPYREPEKLALVYSLGSDGKVSRQGWAPLQWTEWQNEAKSLEGVAAYNWTFNFLLGNDGSESMEGMVVTRDYFKVTGLKPILGRSFNEAEAEDKTPSVMLIGYNFWKRKFNGDPENPREGDPHQPLQSASHDHRCNAARRALSPLARRRPGAELQRKWAGAVLDSSHTHPRAK